MVNKERLKDNITVWDVLEELGAARGARANRVYCPFCHDATSDNPDANVYGFGERYHCFVCGLDGDIITLAQEYLHADFVDACEWLERTFLG